MQKNNIIQIIEFLDTHRGYLKWGGKKLSKKLKVSLEELKIAKKLIKNQGFYELLQNFKEYGTSYNPVDVSFKKEDEFHTNTTAWVGISEEECKALKLDLLVGSDIIDKKRKEIYKNPKVQVHTKQTNNPLEWDIIENLISINKDKNNGWNITEWMKNIAELNYNADFPKWINDNIKPLGTNWGGTSEEECIKIKEKNKVPNTLFISDLHIPYANDKALLFCKKLFIKYDIEEVVFVGDVFDFYGLSIYGKSTSYPGIKNEIGVAKNLIKDWYRVFPKATLLYGNHVDRLRKKLELAGIPEDWLRDLSDILGIPNWDFVTSYETEDYIVVHGTGGMNMEKTVLARGKPVIQGHHHSKTKLEYITDNLWAMQLGALIDLKSYAFHYAKENPIPAIASCGVLYQGNPIIETLK